MAADDPNTLVSTQWLAAQLSHRTVKAIDASWYLPADKRNPRAEYAARHIPGAVFFDIDAVSDTESPYPHMLPSSEQFASSMRSLGIGNTDQVVVYDGAGVFSAPRLWWMLRIMGHEKVAVLDGGLPKWLTEGRPVQTTAFEPSESHFIAQTEAIALRSVEDINANIAAKTAQVLDARAAGRFKGEEPEPRPGLRSGHIPGSFNLPYTKLLSVGGTFLSVAALRKQFEDAGIDLSKPVITSCGSGITAAVLFLGLTLLGCRDIALYDGSWVEWGSREDLPIATGQAG